MLEAVLLLRSLDGAFSVDANFEQQAIHRLSENISKSSEVIDSMTSGIHGPRLWMLL
jgi:hypothetical protein